MSHRYKVREIAQQAGLSEATVDRVLHERPGVRESTRLEVQQAIRDLDKQRSQLRLSGRKYLFDVVMQAPERFSNAFRGAVEAELPALAPAVVRTRFHFRETGSVPAMVETLDRIRTRGPHGAIVKAPDTAEVAEAIDRLTADGIPVVTAIRTSREDAPPSPSRRPRVAMYAEQSAAPPGVGANCNLELLGRTFANVEDEIRRAGDIVERLRDFLGKVMPRWRSVDRGDKRRR